MWDVLGPRRLKTSLIELVDVPMIGDGLGESNEV